MILLKQKQIQRKNLNNLNSNNNNYNQNQHNSNNNYLQSKQANLKHLSNSNYNSLSNNLIVRSQLLSSKCNSSSRVLLGRWKWNVCSAWWCSASRFALRNSNATIAAQSKMPSRKCQSTRCSFVEIAKLEFCLNQEWVITFNARDARLLIKLETQMTNNKPVLHFLTQEIIPCLLKMFKNHLF